MSARPTARHSASNARAVAEGALLADLTVMVVLMGIYVPYAGPALATIAPVPLLLLVLRRGWRVTLEASVVAGLLVSFFTGPFSAFAVVTMLLRSASLGIGLRREWRVRNTVLVGTVFLWACVWAGMTIAALTWPSWRAATEQGLDVTFKQIAGLVGIFCKLFGFGRTWADLSPHLDGLRVWFIQHWLVVLPVVAFPILLVAEAAEYVIMEAILPKFGFTPPPLRLRNPRGQTRRSGEHPSGLRGRFFVAVERRLGAAEAEGRGGKTSQRMRQAIARTRGMADDPGDAEGDLIGVGAEHHAGFEAAVPTNERSRE